MLLNIPAYDYAVDMWSVGMVFARMIFKDKVSKLRGATDFDTVKAIAKVIGTQTI